MSNLFLFPREYNLVHNLFIDIETVPDFSREEYFDVKRRVDSNELNSESEDKSLYWKCKIGGLTPFDGKVVLITYQVDDEETVRLKEWESNEQKILQEFYDRLVGLQHNSKEWLRIIGHNILRFDLLFLYERMKHHKIAGEKWLYHWVIKKPEVIDFLQLHLPINDLKISGLRHDVLAYAYGFPTKKTSGKEETLHYFEKDYDKITEYSKREFVYPEMYKKIRSEGLISKEKLQESIIHNKKQYDLERRQTN